MEKYKSISNGFYPLRSKNSVQFRDDLKNSTSLRTISVKCTRSELVKFNPKEPQLYPFQYIDRDGFLTNRFYLINYIPDILNPKTLDQAIEVVNDYVRTQTLAFWNNKGVIVANIAVYSQDDVPVFDGTFIPLFLLRTEQFNTDKLGPLAVRGGATNVNNVSNILNGPFITEYLQATDKFEIPNLPLANPYLMFPQSNFFGQVTITTDQPGLGPFIAIPTIASIHLIPPPTYPIVALGANASPDITACTPLTPGSLTGKIGVNVRNIPNPCNSLVYPVNLQNAGAIAGITVYLDGPIRLTGTPEQTIPIFTAGPDAQALIDALSVNPNIIVTISPPAAVPTDYQDFTEVISHEVQELSNDSTYGDYIVTSNPPTDLAVLFNQLEVADPIEFLPVSNRVKNHTYLMNPFPTPAYFSANMRYYNYDNSGTVFLPLIPISFQQIVYQQQGQPLQVGNTLGVVASSISNLDLLTNGNIFDPNTFYAPYNTPSVINPVETPIDGSPLQSIYDGLQINNNILLL